MSQKISKDFGDILPIFQELFSNDISLNVLDGHVKQLLRNK